MVNIKLEDINEMDDHPIFRKKLMQKLNTPEKLDQLMVITPTRAWLTLAGLGLLLIAALVWSIFAQVQSTIDASGVLVETAQGMEAVVYISVRDSQRVQEMQLVKLSPAAFRQEEVGLLYGYITEIRQVPVDRASMVTTLKNDALAQSLIARGLIVEARVKLITDDTASGYRWTTRNGPAGILFGDMSVEGKVVIGEDRPIELVWVGK